MVLGLVEHGFGVGACYAIALYTKVISKKQIVFEASTLDVRRPRLG